MAVTAQRGIFGFGPQPAKGTPASAFYQHKSTAIAFGLMDDTRLGPMEIGSGPFPTFPYKAGYVTQGGVTIQPRLEDTFGWLLYGLMGDVSSAQVGSTDAYDHTFKPLAADLSLVPWLTLRKYIPGAAGVPGTDLYEVFEDTKVIAGAFDLAADSPLETQMQFLGIKHEMPANPTWTFENEYEHYDSIPVGCDVDGFIKFTGAGLTDEPLPTARVSVGMVNTPLDIQIEKNVGSPFLDDVTVVSRQMTFDATIKWKSPALYKAIISGQATGTEWAARPMTGALNVQLTAPNVIGTSEHKFSISLNAPDIMWRMTNAIPLAAGEAVLMRFTGVALEPQSNDYATIVLRNGIESYDWPAAYP